MSQNKKDNGWVLCSSKSFPGKYYYFNVLNGETAWTLTEAQVEKTKKQVQYSTIHSNYPEPLTKPPEEASSNTPTHSQPKTPSSTLHGAKHPEPRFGEAIFPVFIPLTKDVPNFVWAPVPIRYRNDTNIQSFKAQKLNMNSVEIVNEKHQTKEDSNQIIVQVHTCNDNYVSKRFVTYNKISKSIETNQTKSKNGNENPFLSSTLSPSAQLKSYFPFNTNNQQFLNDTPNTFQLTKNAENNKNSYVKNPKFIFQSTNYNSEHEEGTFNFQLSTNEANTFRDVIKKNGFVTPNKTTFGYGFDTPNETADRFATPKEKTTEFDTPSFGFHTPKGSICNSDPLKKTSYGFDISEKAIHGFSTPKKTTFGIDTPNKTISGFETPKKTTFGIDTPNKPIPGFDTPISTEIRTEIKEVLNNLPENDLRKKLVQRRRKIENSTNNDENAKKIKTSYDERQATPKKHVTFKLDVSDVSSEDYSYDEYDKDLETPTSLGVESTSSLHHLRVTDDAWYIAMDLDALLDNFEYIDGFVKTDPLCHLLVPYSVYKELTTTSTACDSRARVNSARNVLRRLECGNTRYRVQNKVIESEKLKSQKDQIQCCCKELIRNNIHVVLITNNDILYKEAKEKKIHVYKMTQFQNYRPKTPDVTFDIRKIKFQIPNSKEKNVDNSENHTVKKNDQNGANENHEKKTDEKYKKSVQHFWRSDNSDSDFSIVSQQIEKLKLFEKPSFSENEPKKTQLTSKKQEETVTSSFLKPITNIAINKNAIRKDSASKESLYGNIYETSASKIPENQDNDIQNSTSKNLASKNFENHDFNNQKPTFVEAKQHSIFENFALKESENYPNFIFTNPSPENHNQHTISQKSTSKNIKQSISENPVSKESENRVNDNQCSILKNPASKKAENRGKDSQNSIFEIDSNFMPLTSKTLEDYLKTFDIKNKMAEECLKNSVDEKICCLRQILEDLADVLKESSSKTDNSRACVLYNILQKIRKMYGKHQLIRNVIEKLQMLLYKNDSIDKVTPDLLPIEIMQAIGCGMLLVQLLKELINSEHLTDIEKELNDLMKSIENPISKDLECIENPIALKGDKNEIYDENRANFKRDESEIIQYLKKHYPAWTDFDETTTSLKKKPEIKIFRTYGKDLGLFKLNRSRIIVEKAIKNNESSAEPNSIQFQENDRAKTGNIERDDHTVFDNVEKDKIQNSDDQKLSKTGMCTVLEVFDIGKGLKNTEKTDPKMIRLFANDKRGEKTNFDSKTTDFDAQNELIGLRNTEKSEPKVIRLFSKDKEGEKTNFDSKKTDFDTQNELKGLRNTENSKPKLIRLFSKDEIGEKTDFDTIMINFDSKKTDFGSKMTDFDLNQTVHENTFQATESGPKVVRNITLIPKYEDLFKKSVQNGLQDPEFLLSDTENLTNEDSFLENTETYTKNEENNEILNKTPKHSENFARLVVTDSLNFIDNSIKCYSVSDGSSEDVIDNGVENNLKAAITIFFKEIINCFQNIRNFVDSSFHKIKNKENNTELKSIENTAKQIHGHILRIIEKLSSYKEAEGENMNFSFLYLLNNKENSADLYITKCRQLSSLCIEQAKILEKTVTELCNFNN